MSKRKESPSTEAWTRPEKKTKDQFPGFRRFIASQGICQRIGAQHHVYKAVDMDVSPFVVKEVSEASLLFDIKMFLKDNGFEEWYFFSTQSKSVWNVLCPDRELAEDLTSFQEGVWDNGDQVFRAHDDAKLLAKTRDVNKVILAGSTNSMSVTPDDFRPEYVRQKEAEHVNKHLPGVLTDLVMGYHQDPSMTHRLVAAGMEASKAEVLIGLLAQSMLDKRQQCRLMPVVCENVRRLVATAMTTLRPYPQLVSKSEAHFLVSQINDAPWFVWDSNKANDSMERVMHSILADEELFMVRRMMSPCSAKIPTNGIILSNVNCDTAPSMRQMPSFDVKTTLKGPLHPVSIPCFLVELTRAWHRVNTMTADQVREVCA
jgi:hypothetical protein